MTKRTFIAAGLVAALAGGSAAALAQQPSGDGSGVSQPGPGHRRAGPRGFAGPGRIAVLRGIDLTEAQREQVRTIMQSHQTEFQQVRTKLRDAHRAMADAVQAEMLDEAAIRARSADVGSAMADEAVLNAKVRAEVSSILTAEQQQRVKERRQRRPELN